MPRDAGGVYSLPADSGLLPKDPHIQAWNRAALADISTALTSQISRHGCLLLRTAGQDFPNGINTAFSWQTSVYDPLGLWAASPNPSRITIPSGIAWATFSAAYYNSALTPGIELWPICFFILKNADNFNGAPVFASLVNPETTVHGVTIATPWIPVTAGDYFEVFITQTSTCIQTFAANADNRFRTWFSCEVMT